ncbi:phosphopantetheine-binding protein [Streptomyces nojiriensis]|uniref:phosphopantetheine-binding protein n=1 Tax=Streptomyces nojiriensis TaxID=66374 RepID=UPI002E17BB0B
MPGEYVAPRTEVEQLIADVRADVLGRDRIGVHDDFFDLGGQSLDVARVVNQIQLLTGLEPELAVFFVTPTVAGLAERVIEQFAALEEAAEDPADVET